MQTMFIGVVIGLFLGLVLFSLVYTGTSKVLKDYYELFRIHAAYFSSIFEMLLNSLIIVIPLAFNDYFVKLIADNKLEFKLATFDLSPLLPYIFMFGLIFSLYAIFHFIKNILAKKKEVKIVEKILKAMQTKNFNSKLNETRLTLFVEDYSLFRKLHLKVFARVGAGDDSVTWKINPINAGECESFAGKTWYDGSVRCKNDLPDLVEAKALLTTPGKEAELDQYLHLLGIERKILEKRIKDGKVIPVSLMSCSIKYPGKDKKAVLVIDSKVKIDLPSETEFSKEFSMISVLLDNI